MAIGFSVLGLNHVGLAPKDLGKCRWFFGDVLGLSFLGEELVREQQTTTLMFRSAGIPGASEPRLEALTPSPDGADSPIAKFLEKKGAGIHHIALTVNDIYSAVEHMKSHQVRMVDSSPRKGAHHTLIAFVHPESTGGLLVELVQESPIDK